MISAALALTAGRIAVAIVLDTVALVIWNVGTRSPGRLIADVRAGAKDRSTFARGLIRLVAGAAMLAAGIAVCAPTSLRSIDFTVIESWAMVTALIVEGLIGPDIRRRAGSNEA